MVTLTGLLRLLRAVPLWRPQVLRTLYAQGLTLSALITVAALKNPDGVALIDDDGPLTYAELDQLIEEVDVSTTRVDVREPNHRTFVVAAAAALRHNADAVLHAPAGRERRGEKRPPDGESVVLGGRAGSGDDAEGMVLGGRAGSGDEAEGESGAAAHPPHPSSPRRRDRRSRRRGQVILLTSGSTGVPKEVERGGARLAQALPIGTLLGVLPVHGPVVLTVPLFHGFGLGFLALGLALGVPVVMWRKVDARTVARFIGEHPGCLLVGVPPVLARIARLQTAAHLSAVVSGAGQLHPIVAERLRTAYGDVVFNLYGSSEEGWSTIATPADLRAAPGTIGRAAAGVKVAVLNDDGRPVGDGEVGHLCVSGRLEFKQYGDGGRRARLGGMSDSGDLGHRDPDGRFFVDGRTDDMVVTGGENVFPAEVENVLLQHPAVAEVRVDGVPDDEYGARLEATVVRRHDVQAEELIDWARAGLAGAKTPRGVRFVAELPATASGKYRRRVT
ncbi:AMP-binding protein [Kribbella sp. DT2]|uniref:AMP-binding protein n=1 Tax=Kribbella sp. DT2 TaxID=3393427 RepID=UPI003CF9E85A